MKDLARRLCDYLIGVYGDMTWVTPPVFADALRTVEKLPADASPLYFERWVARYATVRVNTAHSSLAGFNYTVDGEVVIETGNGRSPEERNITILHEFAESLRGPINAELTARGMSAIEWEDRYWDSLAIEIVAPLAIFRRAAQANGCDIIDLFRPLSFEATIQRVAEAFESDAPLFAVYAKNDSVWVRGEGYRDNTWSVAASAWTKRWIASAYDNGREHLPVPRRGARARQGSCLDDVRRRGRALLIHTRDQVAGRTVEVDVLLRARSYGRDIAQVFVVGVEKKFAHMLVPQLQLVGPDERHAEFGQIF